MSGYKNISIKNKLIIIQVATAFIAVFICCAFFLYNDIKIFKVSEVRTKTSIAEVVGDNLVSPILFNDQNAATKILMNFKSNPAILNALLIDKNGKTFAIYDKKGEEKFSFPPEKIIKKSRLLEKHFIVTYRIYQGKEFLGTLSINTEFIDMDAIIYNYIKGALFVFIIGIFVAIIIAIFFQRSTSGRLLALVSKTKTVSETGNYTIRVPSAGKDEIGILSVEFNAMLEKIEKSEKDLKNANNALENRVQERTADLIKSQASLQQSEKKYRKMIEEVGDVVYSSDFNGYFTYFNPIIKKVSGYAENELLGKHFLDIIDPLWKDKVAKFYKEQFDSKTPETTFSFPIITKSGERKWVEQIVTQQKEGDRIIGHNAIVRDITERKKIEDELKRSNERFFTIFDSNAIGMVLINLETNKYFYVNEIFLSSFGYTKEEVIGKTSTELKIIEPESYEKVIRLFKQNGFVKDYETLVRRKNGEVFWSVSSLQTIKINDELFFLSSFYDITERKKTEERLKEYQYFFNNSHDLLCITNHQNYFEIINPNFQKVLDFPEKDLLENKFLNFIHPDDINSTLKEIERLNAGLVTSNFVNRYRKKDDTYLWLEWNATYDSLTGKIYAAARDITERKKSDDKFKSILESAPDALVIVDKKGKIQVVNTQTEKLFGYKREEIIGEEVELLIPARFKEVHPGHRHDFFANPKTRPMGIGLSLFGLHKDGREIPVEISLSPMETIDGLLVSAAIRDITEKKKVEDELKKSNERFFKIFETNSVGMVITDLENGKCQYVNEVFLSTFGYTKEEVIGKTSLELNLIEPESREKALLIMKEKNYIKDFETQVRKKNQEKFWALFSGQIIIVDGKSSILSTFIDITERKKAVEALKNSEIFLESIVENIPNMIFVKDAKDLKFVRFNRAGEDLLGYSKAELIGKNDYDFFPKVEADFFTSKDKKVLESGKLLEIEEEPIHTRFKGERILETKKIPILDNKGKPIYLLGISNDITDLKKILNALDNRTKELERSNSELEQFAYVASHDLQEPLRTISNYVELLEEAYSETKEEDTKQYFTFITSASTRMQTLIKDLLEFSRVGKNPVFAPVDCNKILKEVIAEMDASIKESNAKIIYQVLPVVTGIEIELKRVFQNLISNALKFKRKGVNPEVEIIVEDKGNEYLFAIKDNGIGIEKESIPKLFNIFQRLNTTTEYPGTGIGLATAKKIIDLHKGKIWVESKFNEGSNFYFTIKKENS